MNKDIEYFKIDKNKSVTIRFLPFSFEEFYCSNKKSYISVSKKETCPYCEGGNKPRKKGEIKNEI